MDMTSIVTQISTIRADAILIIFAIITVVLGKRALYFSASMIDSYLR